MSRLVDVDKVTDKEISQYLGVKYASCTEDIRSLIDDQPTAFDVEKVIEELEDLREVELRRPDMCGELGDGDGEAQYNDGVSQGRYEAFIEAIEIVKRGGRDEE